jgi:predicted Zn finger-like uncharacterized protein
MIVQCEACQTKFRLADEKVKPGGTKVRCSKCKEIFTVMPPAPEPEPEPAEETVDFSAMNMEKVEDEPSTEEAPQQEEPPAPEPEPQQEEAPATDEMEVDFSGLEAEMGENADQGEELADEFTFADTSQLTEENDEEEESGDFDLEQTPEDDQADEETDFGAAFEETEDTESGTDFDFSEEPAQDATSSDDSVDFSGPEGGDEIDFSGEDSAAQEEDADEFSFDSDDGALSFDDETSDAPEKTEEEESGEFSFGDDSDNAFSFDEGESTEPATDASEEFSVDEENPFGDDSGSDWDDSGSGDSDSFDFDEPQFDSESAGGTGEEPSSEDDGLQFGEIAFDSDSGDEPGDESAAPNFEENAFESAAMEERDEPESFVEKREAKPPTPDDDDDDLPLPPPPKPKKSALSRILLLLVLLLLILGGAAGFLFVQEGTINVNTITKYLPFLEEYLGKAPESAPVERIGINIQDSAYINGQEGQMLVIQGVAVNNFPAARSSITVKGVLLDEQGGALLQQTVYCGNRLTDAALQSKPWAAIEEAMNNQFGDSLSNMNVGAGASIPFTIVFRNLPDGIANINVEVVKSEPGAG